MSHISRVAMPKTASHTQERCQDSNLGQRERKDGFRWYVRAIRRTVITLGPAFLGTRDRAILEGSKSGG